MKIRKRWISLCLAIILLAGIAFNPGSLVGSQVEAANLEETGEVVTEESTQSSEEAVTVLSETPTDTSSAQPETTDPVTTETPTENTTPTEDTTVTETPVPETPAETPAPEITDTTPAEQPETNTGSAQTETGDNQQETNTEINTDTNSGNEETAGEQEIISERAVLKQEFVDENGNVKQTVIADIPEGAFNARADQLSMEVKFLDASQEEYIVSMMKELLPENENYEVGGYVLYSIDFKVDGVSVEPAKAVTISMTGNELTVKDTEKAHVFRYDPAEPEVAGDEDQLEEIIQKYQLEKNLNESGQGTANIEDYNYSEITVNNENADAISLKGTESGIYGCYVVNDPVTLEGTADGYHVSLTGPASSFPDDGELTLSVKEVSKKTDKVAEEAVEEEAEKEDLQVVDYTALDITILKDGEEVRPLGPVNVTFTKEEKEKSADSKPDQIKVFHVDEETGKAQDMEATEAEEGKVEIETDHFSIYVVVDLDQLGGQIELTVQHWATVNQLDGVNGKDGLNAPGANGKIDATATLNSKNIFTRIYTDDSIKLDNKLNKNVEELSKVLLADANSEIKNYELKAIWVLNDNQTAGTATIDETDTNAFNEEKAKWTTYDLDDTDKTVKLTKNSTIRMIYEPVEASNALSQPVTFYDYNITWNWRKATVDSSQQSDFWENEKHYYWTDGGVNSTDASRGGDQWTGGNANNQLSVGLHNNGFYNNKNDAKAPNGLFINRGNGDGFQAVTGMVTGVKEDGPIYNGIYDTNLFNDKPVNGKTVLNDYTLNFKQVGDVYTLQSVKKGNQTTLDNLDNLREIYDEWAGWAGSYRNIYSNNFWPLDYESYTGIDPKFGDKSFAGASGNLRNSYVNNVSDDKQAHNWFFGMRYDFEFTLGDYEGPLNFYFRGDDDFWLFVDGELKTDLGGIHSAIGAMLDLSYLRDQDKDKTHKITIIYAERGGHGSTCYMQFTLPNVKPVEFDTETPKTSVTVNKVWQDHNNPNRPASIDVELYYRAAGSNDEWTKYDTQTLSTANNWTYTWNNMPKEDYEYRVHEVGEKNGKFGNYRTEYSSPDGMLSQNDTDGTFSGRITNSCSPSTYITVNKVWNDGNDVNSSRPDSVDFYLYYRNQENTDWVQYPNGKLTLTADGNWTGKYNNLPVYWGDTNQKMIYTVMEINGNDPLSNGDKLPGTTGFEYTVSYPEDHIGDDGFGIGYEAKADNMETSQETLNLTVTNSLGVSIKVNKVWKGHDPGNDTVIYVGLYRAGNPVADKWVELNAENDWTETFQYLTPAKDYSVKELREAGSGEKAEFTIDNVGYVGVNSGQETTVDDIKYDVSYGAPILDTSDMSLSTVTITNQAKWQLIKYSSSSQDKEIVLQGAKFELKDTKGAVYTGESDDNGIVKWKKGNQDFTGVFPNGTYTLTETAAPTGYALGDSVTFVMKDGVPVNMDGKNAVIKDGILTFYYANEALYSLPSSGGSGIYWYILGGMLLMMAASLMVYKNKRGEVLERK